MNQATAQQYLPEAEAARHALAMGEREVEITYADGRKVAYGQANIVELDSYIAELRRVASPCRRGPVGFRFGR